MAPVLTAEKLVCAGQVGAWRKGWRGSGNSQIRAAKPLDLVQPLLIRPNTRYSQPDFLSQNIWKLSFDTPIGVAIVITAFILNQTWTLKAVVSLYPGMGVRIHVINRKMDKSILAKLVKPLTPSTR